MKPVYQDERSNEHWEGKLSQIKKTICQKNNELRQSYLDLKNEILDQQSEVKYELIEKQRTENGQLMEILQEISKNVGESSNKHNKF